VFLRGFLKSSRSDGIYQYPIGALCHHIIIGDILEPDLSIHKYTIIYHVLILGDNLEPDVNLCKFRSGSKMSPINLIRKKHGTVCEMVK
jgi:hypothetical protein